MFCGSMRYCRQDNKAPRPHMPNHQMNPDGKISGFGALSWKELSEKLAEKLAVA